MHHHIIASSFKYSLCVAFQVILQSFVSEAEFDHRGTEIPRPTFRLHGKVGQLLERLQEGGHASNKKSEKKLIKIEWYVVV